MKEKSITEKQKDILKKRIEEEKEGLIFKGVYISEEFNVSEDERSDAIDQANAAVSSSERLRFRNRESFYYKKLACALKRIEDGVYGECGDCGKSIGLKRLFARPTAELCITCKEESERNESEHWILKQSKSFGPKVELVNTI